MSHFIRKMSEQLSPPTFEPTPHNIKEHEAAWTSFARKLNDALSVLENKRKEAILQQEIEEWSHETKKERIKRAKNSDNWVKVDDYSDDVPCLNRDNCWYQGNLDRRDEYQGYRLPGVDEIRLCDMCCVDISLDPIVDYYEDEFTASCTKRKRTRKRD
jgi:hypothetical protein